MKYFELQSILMLICTAQMDKLNGRKMICTIRERVSRHDRP